MLKNKIKNNKILFITISTAIVYTVIILFQLLLLVHQNDILVSILFSLLKFASVTFTMLFLLNGLYGVLNFVLLTINWIGKRSLIPFTNNLLKVFIGYAFLIMAFGIALIVQSQFGQSDFM